MINIIKSSIENNKELLKNAKTKKEKNYICQKLIELEKELENEMLKQDKETNKILLEKLGQLKAQRNYTELQNDYMGVKKISREIRKLQAEINERKAGIKFLSFQQIKSIIRSIRKFSKNPTRDELIIQLGFYLGLRVSEIRDLKISDIDFLDCKVQCRRKKNSLTNIIDVPVDTIKLLTKYKNENERSYTDYIFSSSKSNTITPQGINGMFKKYGLMAGIPKEYLHFHILKHSRGVYLAESGIYTTQEIQRILGHKEIKSTLVYTAFSKAQNEAISNKLKNDKNIF